MTKVISRGENDRMSRGSNHGYRTPTVTAIPLVTPRSLFVAKVSGLFKSRQIIAKTFGEVWQIDFGMAAKVRPALVLGCDIAEEDRVLVAVVYHTTALRGSRYEAPMKVGRQGELAS